MQVQSVIVEGGSNLLQSFIDEGLWDEARVITNTSMIVNKGLDAPQLRNAEEADNQKIQNDMISILRHKD